MNLLGDIHTSASSAERVTGSRTSSAVVPELHLPNASSAVAEEGVDLYPSKPEGWLGVDCAADGERPGSLEAMKKSVSFGLPGLEGSLSPL